jgi:RNA polymerase sigma factor (sigma-70 family)
LEQDIVEIWNRFRGGDDSAFAILFELFSEPLYRYGMKFITDESLVKDYIQDLFVKLHEQRASLPPSLNPKFYLLLTMKNLIMDEMIKNQRLVYVPPEELPFIATYSFVDEEFDKEEEEQRMEKFNGIFKMLKPRQKEAIYLRYQLDLSYEEVAGLLGVNYQSARNLIHRSITKIRKNVTVR